MLQFENVVNLVASNSYQLFVYNRTFFIEFVCTANAHVCRHTLFGIRSPLIESLNLILDGPAPQIRLMEIIPGQLRYIRVLHMNESN